MWAEGFVPEIEDTQWWLYFAWPLSYRSHCYSDDGWANHTVNVVMGKYPAHVHVSCVAVTVFQVLGAALHTDRVHITVVPVMHFLSLSTVYREKVKFKEAKLSVSKRQRQESNPKQEFFNQAYISKWLTLALPTYSWWAPSEFLAFLEFVFSSVPL